MPKASGAGEPLGQREQSNSAGGKHNGDLRMRFCCLQGVLCPLPPGRQVPPRETPLLLCMRPSLWKGKLRHRAGTLHRAWKVLTPTRLLCRSLVTCVGGAELFGVSKSLLWGGLGSGRDTNPGGCPQQPRCCCLGTWSSPGRRCPGPSAPRQHPEPAASWPQPC